MKKGTSTQHNIFKSHQTLHDEKQTRSKQARKHCYRTSIQSNQKKKVYQQKSVRQSRENLFNILKSVNSSKSVIGHTISLSIILILLHPHIH